MDDLPHDTDAAAREVQAAVWRRLGEDGRLRLAIQMSEEIREVTADGIRARHPEYDAASVRWALFRLVHGDELFAEAWPNAPRLDP